MDVKKPPQDIEAEKRIIGDMFVDATFANKILKRTKLRPKHFYREIHRRIFEIFRELPINEWDIICVADKARDCGISGIVTTLNETVDESDLERMAADIDSVIRKAIMREILNMGTRLVELVYEVESR